MPVIGSGPGQLPPAGLPSDPAAVKQSEAAQDAQAAEQLKDINKKTTTVKQNAHETNDAFASKRQDVATSATKAERAEASAKLDAQLAPGVLKMVEKQLNTKVDPVRVLTLKNKVSQDPEFKAIVKDFRVTVEQFAKQALVQMEKVPPKVVVPDMGKLATLLQQQAPELNLRSLRIASTQHLESANVAAKAPAQAGAASADASKAKPVESTAKSAAADATKTSEAAAKLGNQADAAKATANAEASKKAESAAADAAKDAAKPAPQAPASPEAAKLSAAAQAVKDALAAEAAKKAGPSGAISAEENLQRMTTQTANLTPQEQDTLKMMKAMAGLQDAIKNGLPLTAEQAFLRQIMPEYEELAFVPGEVNFDQYGNEIVEKEFYDKAEQIMEKFGPSGEQTIMLNTLLFQAINPIEGGAGDGNASSGVIETGAHAGAGGTQTETAANAGAGAPTIETGANAGGVAGGEAVPGGVHITGGQAMSAVDQMGTNYDMGQLVILVLMMVLDDYKKDIDNHMRWAKVHHKMNDAYRKFMAEATQKMMACKQPENSTDLPNRVMIENLTPAPVIGPDGQPTGDVTMVPCEVTMPITDQKADRPEDDSYTPHPASAAQQVNQIKADMANAGLPPPKTEARDGTVFVTSSYMSVDINKVSAEKSRLKNVLQSMKMDMDKDNLSIQKYMDLRKNVFDNITKILKTRSDQWAKSIALLRR